MANESSPNATVEHSREDAIDGLRVIASRRGCKIQQGDVLALELAISVLMKQEARSAPRRVGMDMLRGALVFGMHKGNVSAGTDRVDISGAFDLNTVIEYLNGKLVNAPTITPSATSFIEPEWKMDSAPLHWPYAEREAWKGGYYEAMQAFQKSQSGQ